MNVVGIIAEYNPFHQGHAYQIEKLRELCNADYVIIAMSGNFVQRGAPALMEKYSRAQMALCCGADLILELPALYATASAEHFARGGVSLLNAAGVVTHLGFGAETDDKELLLGLAAVLLEEPESYRESLHIELKKGVSFPAARAAALTCYLSQLPKTGDILTTSDRDCTLEGILASPNNILALEYLQALTSTRSAMIPVPILRQGRGYHDNTIAKPCHDKAMDESCHGKTITPEHREILPFCSASAIRSCLKQDNSPLPETAMPKAAYDILRHYPHPFLYEDDFSALLHYELLTDDAARLASWGDSSPELANRLLAERTNFTNWSGFCQQMKTKNITHARLSRLFAHMLLQIRQKDYKAYPVPSYLRILGFRKSAAPLLSALKAHSSLPLITTPADARQALSKEGGRLLDFDLRATELYRLCLTAKGDDSLKNDFRQQLIRL